MQMKLRYILTSPLTLVPLSFVQMYLTSACWLIFSIVFACVFRHKYRHENVQKIEVENADYRMHDDDDDMDSQIKGATV